MVMDIRKSSALVAWSGALNALCLTTSLHAQVNDTNVPVVPRLAGLPYSNVLVWHYGIRSSLLMSDNLTSQPKGSEQRGGLLEVTPYILATVDQPRQRGYLAYSLRNFYRTTDRETDTGRHDLNARGEIALSDNWLWLSGQAYVRDTGLSPFIATTADPATSSNNRLRYSSFDLAPYITGRMFGDASYLLRYGFNYSDLGGVIPNSTGHTLLGSVTREAPPGGIGWTVKGNGEARDYDNQAKYDTAYFRTGLIFRPEASLRLGVSADYYRNSVLFNSSGKNSGVGPGAFVSWRPNARIGTEADVSRLYYGTSASARAFYRTERFTTGLHYSRGITHNNGAITSLLGSSQTLGGTTTASGQADRPASSNPAADELAQRGLVSSVGSPIASGVLGAPIVLARTIGADAGLIGLRNSALLTIYRTNRESVPTTIGFANITGTLSNIEQTGVTLIASHRASTATTYSSSISLLRSESADSNGLRSDLRTFTLGSRHQIQRSMFVGLTYRLSDMAVTGGLGNDFRENAIIATLGFQVQ